ncbi:L,D-transpeptidase family protein [Photobacterium minamisatsumaniensis]|uniref:L,D-transpeptidase family protein n=1 Tax=Photobacterium minamisatsumaniensis TaxID=2910233 RepID=UPI003D13A262
MSKRNCIQVKTLGLLTILCCSLNAAANDSKIPTQLDFGLIDQPLASNEELCYSATGITCFDSELEKIYRKNNYLPLWSTPELQEALGLRLKTLSYSGIASGVTQRLRELNRLKNKRDQRGYDILATDSYLVYLSLQQQIADSPSMLFRHQELKPASTVEGSIVDSLKLTKEALSYNLLSNPEQHTQLKRSIALADTLSRLPAHRYEVTSKKLVKHDQVIPNGQALLDVLYTYGDLSAEDFDWLKLHAEIVNSGLVNQAIRRFQARNGLESDGILGPATMHQLSLPYKEVSRLIALNLQRSQLGASGGDRPQIKVNIPDYQLQITYNEQVVFESKVIVGRTARPTNLFSSSLNTMVVNPRWNVPETIKKKDVIPGIKASPDYLQKKNLKMIRSWRDRSELSAEIVEWSNVNPDTFPYEFMQGPGPQNALGNVKFLMPNDYSVYLHDTPSRSLFNKTKRNLSSGCVRVEKAAELASYILDYQQRPSWRSYDQLVSNRQTDTISLPRRIDVDVTYVTAWVDENNQLQMREDIYGYDRPSRHTAKLKYSTLKNYRY